MLGPVGAKRNVSGLKGHGMSAQGKRPGLAIQKEPNALKGYSNPIRKGFPCRNRSSKT